MRYIYKFNHRYHFTIMVGCNIATCRAILARSKPFLSYHWPDEISKWKVIKLGQTDILGRDRILVHNLV